jgi:hypothetical protein
MIPVVENNIDMRGKDLDINIPLKKEVQGEWLTCSTFI